MSHSIFLPMVRTAALPPVVIAGQRRKIILANYAVAPEVLEPYLPARTTLNAWDGVYYVTLEAFLFDHIKVRGMAVPFLHDMMEVGLRFYAMPNDAGQDHRGVVPIERITNKPFIALGANLFHRGTYDVMQMARAWKISALKPQQRIQYTWSKKGFEYSMKVKAGRTPVHVAPGTTEYFLTAQPYAFTRRGEDSTWKYRVEHPLWDLYETIKYKIDVDFGALFGEHFSFLSDARPRSVFLAEGSDVAIRQRQRL